MCMYTWGNTIVHFPCRSSFLGLQVSWNLYPEFGQEALPLIWLPTNRRAQLKKKKTCIWKCFKYVRSVFCPPQAGCLPKPSVHLGRGGGSEEHGEQFPCAAALAGSHRALVLQSLPQGVAIWPRWPAHSLIPPSALLCILLQSVHWNKCIYYI